MFPPSETVFTDLLGSVKEGSIDIAATALTNTPDREAVLAFSYPYLSTGGIALLVKPPIDYTYYDYTGPMFEDYSIDSLVNLNYTFGTIRNSAVADVLENGLIPELNGLWQNNSVATLEEGIDKVRTEDYALVLDTVIAEFNADKRPCNLAVLHLVDSVPEYSSYGFVTSWANGDLERFLSDSIEQLIADGTLYRLQNLYFTAAEECTWVYNPNEQ